MKNAVGSCRVAAMLKSGVVETPRLRVLFESIVPGLYRYPAIDAGAFRRAVEEVVSPP